MKSSLKILLLILISLSISCQEESEQTCIPGKNCPYNQGECSDDQCSCKDGFYTLIDPTISIVNQTFCNYKQISMKLMLLFEVLVPGVGHLYSRQWIFGAIKFVLFISYIIISFKSEEKKFFIPKCFILAKNALIGGVDNKEDDDKKKKKENDEDDKNDNDKDQNDDMIIDNKGYQKMTDNDKQNAKEVLYDCISLKPIDKKFVEFGGSSKCKCIGKMEIYIFWVVYSIDIYLIFFKIYPDANGIPYSD